MSVVRRVRPGSVVDVVAPAGPFDETLLRRGCEVIEARGLRPRFRSDIFTRDRYLAGSDERRLEELTDALDAPDSDLIWCARGGYGTTRLLPALDVARVRSAGKMLVGFSDITALHALWQAAGVPSVHGSMVARLATEPEHVVDRLFRLLLSGEPPEPLEGRPLMPGMAQGPLAGGNLALLAAMCGTPSQPDLRGTVLFLEEVGERPYRLDRLLTQCAQAGLFDGIVALAIGDFTACDESDGSITARLVVADFARQRGVPTVTDLTCGHGAVNHALPFGRQVMLDADAGRLVFLDPLLDPS